MTAGKIFHQNRKKNIGKGTNCGAALPIPRWYTGKIVK